ncbi:hypothetical protein M409DRAFT_70985 [Zasmidium cellare ATCC 36951]|uniref:Zn(2)-C6 fungal-type domain-containing protein n=1 Tax=Zasmidium cellare ATCC 36951 TaxID=1080233 RepID=A0A6A6BY77_ZASCE|nr:uncharacterized protein M409DRAFT_70985 [Zasmidium cellare ATCC 36951]KAF2159553.1 hypothetical protein M409DRAFT_70985 [Zasmidium cellare ATCC 36951]
MTVPIVRQRAKAPKTRTGCKTCRQRHIKCDETKPACQRCARSGRQCGGYDTVKNPNDVRKLPFVQPKHLSPGTALSPVLQSPGGSLQRMGTTERNAFDYFRMQTVHQLPGNAWLLSWERLSITASLTEPAILHAIIALGSLHQAYGIFSPSHYIKGSSVDHSLHDFAINQCNKAMVLASSHIGNLSSTSSDAEVQVVMLMSLLMFCFEVWCGQDLRASFHLRTGLRILYDRVKLPGDTSSAEKKRLVEVKVNPQSDMDILLQTFVRLDMDLTIQGRTDPFLYPVIKEDIPSVFSSLQDAMVYLDALAASIQDVYRQIFERALGGLRDDGVGDLDDDRLWMLASVHSRTIDLSSNPDLAARVDQGKRDVSRWMSAFAFIPFTSDRQSAHLLAQIQAFCLWHEVSFWRESNEMLLDRFEEQYDYILGLAERYVELHRHGSPPSSPGSPGSDSDSRGSTRPAFSLGTGLVPCIFVIAFKCRKSSIRRRAVDLVRSINLTGVFDAYCVASFCQTIIDIEENAARQILGTDIDDFQTHQIPREARLIDVNMTEWSKSEFYKSDHCRMVYAKLGEEGEIAVGLKDFAIVRSTTPIEIDPRLLGCEG